MTKSYYSHFARAERRKNLKKIILGITGTITLLVFLIYFGLPLLIKFSLFLENLRGESLPPSTEDTTTPFPPILESLPKATNRAYIDIRGYAEPGSTVTLFINNKLRTTVLAGKDGSFLIGDVYLKEGENIISTKATDAAGNESQNSTPFSIVFKKGAPFLEIESPSDEEEFTDKDIEISGKTDPDVTLTINGRQVIVQKNGGFKHTLSLSEGENTIKIVARDNAGNSKERVLKVAFNP